MPATAPKMTFGVVGEPMVVGAGDVELRRIEEGAAFEGTHRAPEPQYVPEGTLYPDGTPVPPGTLMPEGAALQESDALPPPPGEDDAPEGLKAEPIEDDGVDTGEFDGADDDVDEAGMPKKVKKAKDVIATGYSDIVAKYHKGDPGLGVPAFPQGPVCDASLKRAELSVHTVQGYDETVHFVCKWIMGCCTCLPALTGLILAAEGNTPPLSYGAEFLRCFCWMPTLAAHTDAEAVIKVSKGTLKPFKGLGDVEKVNLVAQWFQTLIKSSFLGLEFAQAYPDGLVDHAQQMNMFGYLGQVGGPILYVVVKFTLYDSSFDYGFAVMLGALVAGLVNLCIQMVIFGGLGNVGNVIKASRKKIDAGCSCALECQEYYDAGGLKGFAESKKKVKGEVKKIREATKVYKKYTDKLAAQAGADSKA